MERKLILPAEIKVCATCSYWDGERKVDGEMQLVVVVEDCKGECLAKEAHCHGLGDTSADDDCLWEPLAADIAEGKAEDAGAA